VLSCYQICPCTGQAREAVTDESERQPGSSDERKVQRPGFGILSALPIGGAADEPVFAAPAGGIPY
jgi:hypothetical protein